MDSHSRDSSPSPGPESDAMPGPESAEPTAGKEAPLMPGEPTVPEKEAPAMAGEPTKPEKAAPPLPGESEPIKRAERPTKPKQCFVVVQVKDPAALRKDPVENIFEAFMHWLQKMLLKIFEDNDEAMDYIAKQDRGNNHYFVFVFNMSQEQLNEMLTGKDRQMFFSSASQVTHISPEGQEQKVQLDSQAPEGHAPKIDQMPVDFKISGASMDEYNSLQCGIMQAGEIEDSTVACVRIPGREGQPAVYNVYGKEALDKWSKGAEKFIDPLSGQEVSKSDVVTLDAQQVKDRAVHEFGPPTPEVSAGPSMGPPSK